MTRRPVDTGLLHLLAGGQHLQPELELGIPARPYMRVEVVPHKHEQTNNTGHYGDSEQRHPNTPGRQSKCQLRCTPAASVSNHAARVSLPELTTRPPQPEHLGGYGPRVRSEPAV